MVVRQKGGIAIAMPNRSLKLVPTKSIIFKIHLRVTAACLSVLELVPA